MSDFELYYIQAQGYVGNSIIWWGENSGGYTTNLKKAGRYTKEEAQAICRSRGADTAWPCDYIDSIAVPHVDSQHVNYKNAKRWTKKKPPFTIGQNR